MASVDAEADMENLFAEEDVGQNGESLDTSQTLTQEEQQRIEGGANLDVTGTGEVKKRVIKNPQPKLNPERLMGQRGIQTIEELFSDWESRGKGKEFEDLDIIMKKMEHWAHRLYPKLPFDEVLNIIANRLGKKKVVQTHVKKIRLGMATQPVHIGADEDLVVDNTDHEVERYGDEDQPDVFNELLKQAGAGDHPPLPPVNPVGRPGLTDEQRERIRINKELAAARKKEKQDKERRAAEELENIATAPSATEWNNDLPTENSEHEVSNIKSNIEEESNPRITNDESEELMDLDQMLEHVED